MFWLYKILVMKRTFRFVVSCVFILSSFPVFSGNEIKNSTNEFDWSPVMDAIIQVESGGNRMARNGKQVGVMQITPIAVAECNKILRLRKSKRRYSLSDRYSVSKSKEMFVLIQSFHNPQNDVEQAIRAWNGGPNYSLVRTQRYYEKVIRHLMNG